MYKNKHDNAMFTSDIPEDIVFFDETDFEDIPYDPDFRSDEDIIQAYEDLIESEYKTPAEQNGEVITSWGNVKDENNNIDWIDYMRRYSK